jgi:hypothetical protein
VLLGVTAVLQAYRLISVRATAGSDQVEGPASIEPGQILPSTELLSLHAGSKRLPELFGERCGIVVFYSASCPYCRELATQGAFRGSLRGIPIVWVSTPDRVAHAVDFVREFRLPGPAFMLRSWVDARAMGIVGTPRIMAIGPNARFLAAVSRRTLSLPESCMSGGER